MITATGENSALAKATQATHQNPKGTLGKDDFMKLLLTELRYQDPTAPMDTEKILAQTSQLATLESADNTNNTLEKLAKSLGNAQQFSTISAIGKTADLGSDSIAHDKGSSSTFEIYFPNDVQNGTVSIKNSSGEVVKTLNVKTNPSGVYQFTWDGTNQSGNGADDGIYHVSANYADAKGVTHETKLGAYPVESVKFDDGKALLKLGSNYIPLENIKEIY